MNEIAARLRTAYAVLEPKWRYIAETLGELLTVVLLVLAVAVGFVPWLLWQGARRLIPRLRKEAEGHGPAENADS